MSSTCESCPSANRLAPSREVAVATSWANLPNPVLTEVFNMLNEEDRRNASGVCRHWRENYFQPRWFSAVTFPIKSDDLEKSMFLNNTFGSNVRDADIILYSLSSECVKELINLLQKLSRNNNLKSLYIRPFQCSSKMSSSKAVASFDDIEKMECLLREILPRVCPLEIDCVDDLSLIAETIIEHLNLSSIPGLAQDVEIVLNQHFFIQFRY